MIICCLTGKRASLPLSHWILEIPCSKHCSISFDNGMTCLQIHPVHLVSMLPYLASFLSRSIGFNTGYIKFGFNICALAMTFFSFSVIFLLASYTEVFRKNKILAVLTTLVKTVKKQQTSVIFPKIQLELTLLVQGLCSVINMNAL